MSNFYERFDQMFGERDGRLSRRKIATVRGAAGPLSSRLWEPVFCYCGAPGGHVTLGTPILYVCQQCTETLGRLPLPMVPGTEED